MQKLEANSPLAQSADLVAANIHQLKALFPELITDGPNGVAVNVDVLKALVGDQTANDTEEKFGLNWHGKRRARQLALTPSTGTLRPCPEESVDWDITKNLMIEGDNLEVLKLLQKSYAGEVKLIYIDPPYNTGNDFVYPDDFKDGVRRYLELTGQASEGQANSSNSESGGRFHTNWLNMMLPRIKLARSLLDKEGAILVSIGDRELPHLIALMNEIFGEENQIGIFTWKSRAKPTNAGDARFRAQKVGEYVVAYGRKPGDELLLNVVSSKQRTYPNQDADGRFRTVTILTSNRGTFRRETMRFESGGYTPDEDNRWKAGKPTIDDLFARKRIQFNDDGVPMEKKYDHEENDPLYPIYCFMDPDLTGTAEHGKSEVNELLGNQHGVDTIKPVGLLKYFISTFAGNNDTVVDFFAGTGTTAQAVYELNAEDGGSRRFVLVQLPLPLDKADKNARTSAEFCERLDKPALLSEITKERIRQAGNKARAIPPNTDVVARDFGFRVFKLDHSNIRAWNPEPSTLEQSLFEHQDHLLEGRSEADVLYELLLKLGIDLCVGIEQRTVLGKEVHAVGGGVLMACLATAIAATEVEAIALGIVNWHKELAPAGDTTCVFRDSAFADDVAKTNMAAIFHQHGIANVRSL